MNDVGNARTRASVELQIVDSAPGPDGKNPHSGLPNNKGLTSAINLYLRHFVGRPRSDLRGALTVITTDLIGATATKQEAARLLDLKESDAIALPIGTVNQVLWQATNDVVFEVNRTALHSIGRSGRSMPNSTSFQVTGDGFANVVLDVETPASTFGRFLPDIAKRFNKLFPRALGARFGPGDAQRLLRGGPLEHVAIRWGSASLPVAEVMLPYDGVTTEAVVPGKVSHLAAGTRTHLLTAISNGQCNGGRGLSDPLRESVAGMVSLEGGALGRVDVSIESGAFAIAGSLERCFRGSESALAAGFVDPAQARLSNAQAWDGP